LEARLFVYAAGYGLKGLVEELFPDVGFPLRFWRSHLLILDRLARHGAFFLDPGEAAAMHHGGRSIVGLNEDAERLDQPSWVPNEARRQKYLDALARLVPAAAGQGHEYIACTKVDIAPDFDRNQRPADRSLNVAHGELAP